MQKIAAESQVLLVILPHPHPCILNSSLLWFYQYSLYYYVGVAFPFAVNAAAVLLAVEIERLGQVATIRVVLPEVGVKEFDTLFLCQFATDFSKKAMFLVGADEQGGSESVEAHLAGSFSRFGEAQVEAVLTATGFVPGYPAEVFNHIVTIGYSQLQIYLLCQRLHSFQAVLVLRIGVDVGVIPQGADLIAVLSPVVDGVSSAVGTADMNKNGFHHKLG